MDAPYKLTPEVFQAIVDAVRGGVWGGNAARVADIAPATFYEWMARGKDPNDPCATFRVAILQARAENVARAENTIARAVEAGDWKAAAYLLENRNHRGDLRHARKTQKLQRQKMRAEIASIEATTELTRKRIEGTLVDRLDVTSKGEALTIWSPPEKDP